MKIMSATCLSVGVGIDNRFCIEIGDIFNEEDASSVDLTPLAYQQPVSFHRGSKYLGMLDVHFVHFVCQTHVNLR